MKQQQTAHKPTYLHKYVEIKTMFNLLKNQILLFLKLISCSLLSTKPSVKTVMRRLR